EKWSQIGAQVWAEAQPGGDSLARTYLESRNIRLASWPEALRFHPGVEHPKLKQKFPALVAEVSGAEEPAWQITFLKPDGTGKAELDKLEQRRSFGPTKGGILVLADAVAGKPLLVGEGVES